MTKIKSFSIQQPRIHQQPNLPLIQPDPLLIMHQIVKLMVQQKPIAVNIVRILTYYYLLIISSQCLSILRPRHLPIRFQVGRLQPTKMTDSMLRRTRSLELYIQCVYPLRQLLYTISNWLAHLLINEVNYLTDGFIHLCVYQIHMTVYTG